MRHTWWQTPPGNTKCSVEPTLFLNTSIMMLGAFTHAGVSMRGTARHPRQGVNLLYLPGSYTRQRRGLVLEQLLTKLMHARASSPGVAARLQLVAMSATMSGLEDMRAWLDAVRHRGK
jgi:hypothetical protein